jgi:hypothetical protein
LVLRTNRSGDQTPRQAISFRAQVDTSLQRQDTFGGRDYTVVPVIALVEGVLQSMNSSQPELALASEFGRFAAGWNGRPLVMGHPQVNGSPVSANSPDILEQYQMGFLFNSKLDGTKLYTEAWIDNERTKGLNDEAAKALRRLQDGEIVEVSTGLWANVVQRSGYHGNQAYKGVWENVVPDHLAILPNGTLGACSVEDGCGANRVNAATGSAPAIVPRAGASVVPTSTNSSAVSSLVDARPAPTDSSWRDYSMAATTPVLRTGCSCETETSPAPAANETLLSRIFSRLTGKSVTVEEIRAAQVEPQFDPQRILDGLMVNEAPAGMLSTDVSNLLRQAIKVACSGANSYAYVLGFTRDHVIYEHYDFATMEGFVTYRRSYSIAQDGSSATLGDDVVRVNLITQIVVADDAGTASTRANASAQERSEETTQMAGEPTPGAGSAPNVPTGATPTAPAATGSETPPPVPATPAAPPAAPSVQAAPVAPPTFEQLMASASPEIREQFEQGQRVLQAQKNGIIAGLKASGRCKFTDEQLKAFSLGQPHQARCRRRRLARYRRRRR